MSNPNWNKDSNAGRNSKGGVKGNWSDRGTISIPDASPKEKEKAISIAKGPKTLKGPTEIAREISKLAHQKKAVRHHQMLENMSDLE